VTEIIEVAMHLLTAT